MSIIFQRNSLFKQGPQRETPNELLSKKQIFTLPFAQHGSGVTGDFIRTKTSICDFWPSIEDYAVLLFVNCCRQ